MKKVLLKTLAGALSVALALGVLPYAQAARNVLPDHWSAQAIEHAVERGYLQGDANGEINPDAGMTRAEFTTMVLRMVGQQPFGTSTFDDVPADAWYRAYVAAAVNRGIVSGFGDGTFRPNQSINRQEAVTILSRAWNVEATTVVTVPMAFADASWIDAWAMPHVHAMLENGWVTGTPGDNDTLWFNPAAQITFGETAQISFNRSRRQGSNVIVILPILNPTPAPNRVVRHSTYPPDVAPELAGATENSITLVPIAAPSGWVTEYRMLPLGAWRTSVVFTGLTANGTYTFEARFAAVNLDTHMDTLAGPSASFTTGVTRLTTTPPPAPTAADGGITYNSITLNAITPPVGWTTQYRMFGMGWQASPTFTSLPSAMGFAFEARFYPVNDATHAPSASSVPSETIFTLAAPDPTPDP